MTTTRKLADYQNGNIHVMIYPDGTKVREYEGNPAPVHPESIDLKITDWCDGGCSWCHENSTPTGKHAEFKTILRMIEGLPAGVEVAIGGGDPLSHPKIFDILQTAAHRGLIANLTVNGQHIYQHYQKITELRQENLIHGLGVSYDDGIWTDFSEKGKPYDEVRGYFQFNEFVDDNTIVHFIAGEHDPMDVFSMLMIHPKILVLGYKQFGRGIKHFSPRITHRLGAWRYWIHTIMSKGVVCFDNLALDQLKIRDRIPKKQWNDCYMGDDGTFTMYADAVRNEFATTSTAMRFPANGQTAIQFFDNHKRHT
jgi:hypothetical protein